MDQILHSAVLHIDVLKFLNRFTNSYEHNLLENGDADADVIPHNRLQAKTKFGCSPLVEVKKLNSENEKVGQ